MSEGPSKQRDGQQGPDRAITARPVHMPVRSERTPSKVLRVIGMVVMFPTAIVLLSALATAWARVDSFITGGALDVLAVAFPIFLLSVILILIGSLLELGARKAWPSAGGFVAKWNGILALAFGVLLFVSALVFYGLSDGDDTERAIGARLLSLCLPFILGGILFLVAGDHVLRRTSLRSYAGIDGGLAAAVLILGFLVANPAAVGADLVAAARDFEDEAGLHDAQDAQERARHVPAETKWFNGTVAGTRIAGAGQNLPDADHVFPFRTNGSAPYAVFEMRWDEAEVDHLSLIVERYQDGTWSRVDQHAASPVLRLELVLPQAGEYRTRVFVADDGDSTQGTGFEEAVSLFTTTPADSYTAFPDG